MLKKRIIFTLLYDQGTLVLSRNFGLQKAGDLRWLKENYDFSRVGEYEMLSKHDNCYTREQIK
jgi:imidazole glycerol-phosphate synthase subunit HisF